MFSENAKKHAEACRFCWMCRHLCPVGLKTGKEANTPRAKGLLVSMALRGFPIDADTAQSMYECVLCGSCTNDCVTGYDPPLYIREARTQAAVAGLTPKAMEKVIDRLTTKGNIFGEEASKVDMTSAQKKADVLVFFGPTASYRTPEIANALLSLLKKADVSFMVLKNEPTSGVDMLDMVGPVEDARQMAMTCAEVINQTGAKTLVVLDSYDAAMFRHEYADWGIKILPEMTTATAFIDKLIKEGRLHVNKTQGTVTYHDGSRLARDLDEHQPARDMIDALGLSLKEMFLNKRLAKCCGTSIFGQYAPDMAVLTSQGRWEDAQRTQADTLVSACPQSYLALSLAIPENYTLKDIFMLLDENTAL